MDLYSGMAKYALKGVGEILVVKGLQQQPDKYFLFQEKGYQPIFSFFVYFRAAQGRS